MAPRLRTTYLAAAAALALALLMMMMPVSDAAAQSTVGAVRLVPPVSEPPPSHDTFTVWVGLEDLQHFGAVAYDDTRDTTPDRTEPSTGLGAFEFTLRFDPAVVAVEAIGPGPDLGRTGRSFQCLPPDGREPGAVTFACASFGPRPDGPQGSLTLGTVTLRRIGAGTTPLMLEAKLSGPLGDEASVSVNGGVARLPKAPGGATASPDGDPPADATAARNPIQSIATAVADGDADVDTSNPDNPDATRAAALATAQAGAIATPGVEARRGDADQGVEQALEGGPGEFARAGGGEGGGRAVLWSALGAGAAVAAGLAVLGGTFLWRRGA